VLGRQRGDTIIEVLFATTIFSLIAVGSLSIMNQGTALAQRSLEITLAREQIDAQGDALRLLNQAYIADFGKSGAATTRWNSIVLANAVAQAVPFDSIVDGNNHCTIPAPAEKPFALNIERLDSVDPLVPVVADAGTYSQIRYDLPLPTSEGLWIQAVRSPVMSGQTGYYDFHIRACWQSPGDVRPVTIGTIVRLYEPRS
jgi:type II secretory pathway pseudopilin PulG